MVELIGRLWRGEVPLPQAFWRYAGIDLFDEKQRDAWIENLVDLIIP